MPPASTISMDEDSSDLVKISPPPSSSSFDDLAGEEYDEKFQGDSSMTPTPSATGTGTATPSIMSLNTGDLSSAPPYSRSVSESAFAAVGDSAESESAGSTVSDLGEIDVAVIGAAIGSRGPRASAEASKQNDGTSTTEDAAKDEKQGLDVAPDTDEKLVKDVQGVMEDTVKRVRERSDKIQRLARPYADRTRSFAEQRPILFTFLALWLSFSAIPLLFFIGFAVAASVFIGGTAIFVLCASIIGTVLVAAGCLVGTILFGVTLLLPVLFFTTLLATGALATLISLFLVHRLYLHLSAAISSSASASASTSMGGKIDLESLSTGVKSWFHETIGRIEAFSPLRRPASVEQVVVVVDEKKDLLAKAGTQTKTRLSRAGREYKWDDDGPIFSLRGEKDKDKYHPRPSGVYDWHRQTGNGNDREQVYDEKVGGKVQVPPFDA